MNRLNIGCGPEPPGGWSNVDRVDYGQCAVGVAGDTASLVDDRLTFGGWVGDITAGMPHYATDSFDCAVAHHSLQQIPYVELLTVLVEVRRVLRPGGVFRISVPDLLGAFDAWRRADGAWFPIVDDAERYVGGKLAAYVTWYSEARMVFTPGSLAEWSVRAGFAQTAVCAAGLTVLGDPGICDLDTRPDESIFMEAQK